LAQKGFTALTTQENGKYVNAIDSSTGRADEDEFNAIEALLTKDK
jgi:hypothetical protein